MDFKPGLTRQYRNLLDVVRASIHKSRGGADSVAIAMDVSPSTISKMLNKQDDPNNQRRFPLEHLETVIEETKDLDPIFYLIEKFCVDNEVKRKQAIAQIPALIDKLQELVREAEGK